MIRPKIKDGEVIPPSQIDVKVKEAAIKDVIEYLSNSDEFHIDEDKKQILIELLNKHFIPFSDYRELAVCLDQKGLRNKEESEFFDDVNAINSLINDCISSVLYPTSIVLDDTNKQ